MDLWPLFVSENMPKQNNVRAAATDIQVSLTATQFADQAATSTKHSFNFEQLLAIATLPQNWHAAWHGSLARMLLHHLLS